MWEAMGANALKNVFGAIENNRASVREYNKQLRANQAKNQAIQEANLQNTIRTGYRVGILNVQRGQAKVAAVQQGRDIGIKARQALGQSQANAGASGSIGASIDAVVEDIERKQDEAQGNVDQNWENTQQNFDEQLNGIVQSGVDALQSARSIDYSGPQTQDLFTAAVVGAAQSGAAFYQDYAISNMKLGLGSKTENKTNTSPGLTSNGISATGKVGSSNIYSLGYK